MPELPDVEGHRRTLRRRATNKPVLSVHVDPDVVRSSSPQAIGRALKGRTFESPHRRGKWLACPTDGPVLVLHFGMTGDLLWWDAEPDRHPHDRIRIEFHDGELVFRDMRKLGGVWIARDRRELDRLLAHVGPDALEVSKKEFLDRVRSRRGSIKSALMNQAVVSGLGNLTVDESLWRARIRPGRSASSLTQDELDALHRSAKRVLRDSSKVGHVPGRRGWITGSREPDAPCPRCGERLRRSTISGRTTYWCPACQS